MSSESTRIGSLILRTVTRLILALLLLFSIFLLLRGHNMPGGGFSGGLVGALALVVYAIAYDVETARQLLRFGPRQLMSVGLLAAAGSGAMGLLAGDEFLTGEWISLTLPGLGEITVGTPLIFDVGVYLVVVGIVVMIVFPLAEE